MKTTFFVEKEKYDNLSKRNSEEEEKEREEKKHRSRKSSFLAQPVIIKNFI